MRTRLYAAAVLLVLLLTAPAGAQTIRQYVAQWTDKPPVIDGKLDDAMWSRAAEEGGFVRVSDNHKRPEAPTFVRVLTDGKAIYLGVRCVEPKMDQLKVTPRKHDEQTWLDDSLEIILDPDNQKLKVFHLIINSDGVQYDAECKVTPPETANDDPDWNGKWESVCSRGKGEWYAECRLPFDAFGISLDKGACVGLNVGRGRIGALEEYSSWNPTRQDFVNPACLGEVYLPDTKGQTLSVGLPNPGDVVRGEDKLSLGFANSFAQPVKVRWTLDLNSAMAGTSLSAQPSAGKQSKFHDEGTCTVPAGSLKIAVPLHATQAGDCGLKLSVADADSGRTLYNGFRSFRTLPELWVDEALYALYYHRAEANITANMKPDAMKGAKLEVQLLRNGTESPLESRTLRVRSGSPINVRFSLKGQSAGDFLIRARLVKGGETIASADSLPMPYTPNPTVGWDKDGFLTVEGKPYFPVGLYTIQALTGENDGVMEECRQAGFNTTVFYAYTVDTVTPLLDAAARHGIRAFVYPADPYHVRENTATRDEVVGEVKARMNHPALLGWYVVDEPEGIGVSSVQTVRNYYQLVKETDPSHPCSLVIMSARAAANYGNSTDMVWIDPYPIPHAPVTNVSNAMDGAHASVAKDKPVWCVPQAFDWSVWRSGKVDKIHRPTPEEERCMTYLALTHGAKGIIYWAHTGSKYYIHDYPAHWEAMKKIAGELRDLSPVLLTVDSRVKVNVSPRSATLDTMVKKLDGQTYLFTVNRETKGFQASFTLDGLTPRSAVEVMFENRTLTPDGESWTDQFRPLEVHVYRLKAR